jgi:long-chain fatty acid transport protein
MANKRVLLLSISALAVFMFSDVLAGGFSVSAVGTRARSMAGAFRAVADDWSAVYYNPAGLARMEQSQLGFGLGLDTYRPSFDPKVSQNGYSFGFPTGERYPDDLTAHIPSLSAVLVAPLGKPVSVGFAVYQPFDENLRWDIYRFPEGYDPNSGKLPQIEYTSNVDVVNFHTALATSFADDKLHVGVGFSIRRGDYLTGQMSLVPSTMPSPLNARPYDMLAKWSLIDVSGLGYGFNAGLLYDVNERISVGASYQSKATIKMDGDVFVKLFTPDNQSIQSKYAEEEVDTLFSGYTMNAFHRADVDMVVPSEFGFGVSYAASEKVTVAADVAFTRWSELKDVETRYTESLGPLGVDAWPMIRQILMGEIAYPYNWDDAVRFSIGAEGMLNDRIKLRGGYSFDQGAVPDEEASPLLTDTGNRHHFAAGASYLHDIFEFAGSAELVALPERDVDSQSDSNNDGIWDNLSGTYKNTAFNVALSLTIKF